jgi:DNA-directed RNA polymerase subunit RPC12/RpoP
VAEVEVSNMPREQHDEEYGYQTLVRVFGLFAALLFVGAMAIPTVIEPGHFTPAGYVVTVVWVAILVGGVICCGKVRAGYRCPKCGTRLPPMQTEGSTKYEHRFHCQRCDIVWTTGVHEGDG